MTICEWCNQAGRTFYERIITDPKQSCGKEVNLCQNCQNVLERCVTLLKATYNLLKKQVESPFVLNILEETVFYDETDCDGYCLMEDIADELMLIENKTSI